MNYLTNYYKNLCEQLQYKATKLEHLVESIIDDGGDGMGGPNDTRGRNRVPPGSIPAPKGPRPTVMYDVPTVTQDGYHYPTIPGDFKKPPNRGWIPEIDYEDIQREMLDIEALFQLLMRMRYANGINILSRWLFLQFGITLGDEPGDPLFKIQEKLRKALNAKYPPGTTTKEARKTLEQILENNWKRLLDVWKKEIVRYPEPSYLDSENWDTPREKPKKFNPTARERSFERWNRQNY